MVNNELLGWNVQNMPSLEHAFNRVQNGVESTRIEITQSHWF